MSCRTTFSIVLPSRNRPQLVRAVLESIARLQCRRFEVIVSDNWSDESLAEEVREIVETRQCDVDLRLVRPPQQLAIPQHFDFAVSHASQEYVMVLTDKMLVLPDLLDRASSAIAETDADLVSWTYAVYVTEAGSDPFGEGKFFVPPNQSGKSFESFDPIEALSSKAGLNVYRPGQESRDYVKGKLIFGCYHQDLVKRLKDNFGSVTLGATHDYSAMVGALSLCARPVLLGQVGIVMLGNASYSIGTSTANDSSEALAYLAALPHAAEVDSAMFIPGLYASQHNWVFADYNLRLPSYLKSRIVDEPSWIEAIARDLFNPGRIWLNDAERDSQVALLRSALTRRKGALRGILLWEWLKISSRLYFALRTTSLRRFLNSGLGRYVLRLFGTERARSGLSLASLESALELLKSGKHPG